MIDPERPSFLMCTVTVSYRRARLAFHVIDEKTKNETKANVPPNARFWYNDPVQFPPSPARTRNGKASLISYLIPRGPVF